MIKSRVQEMTVWPSLGKDPVNEPCYTHGGQYDAGLLIRTRPVG